MKRKAKRPSFRKPSFAVSERMKRVKGSNTKIEKIMEKLLRKERIKYRKQINLLGLPGRPDFKIKGTNILIFCDSSFWHGRRTREITGRAFKRNKDFWSNKLTENKKRDARINRILRKNDWRVLRFWDTNILNSPERVIKRIVKEAEKA
jgi:DNA mismatch endonuclease (patch repair protein)